MTPLFKHAALSHFSSALQEGQSVVIESLWDAPKALLLAIASSLGKRAVCVLLGSGKEEATLFHDLPLFTDQPLFEFPAWETLPGEEMPPSLDVIGERFSVLHSLKEQKKPPIVLAPLQAALQKLLPPKVQKKWTQTLCVQQEIDRQTLVERLQLMGYERKPLVTDKGEYAIRGSIIDLFPITSSAPIRLDFFDDSIESIRLFDPISQKSFENRQKTLITAASEKKLLETSKDLVTLFDYLGKETLIVVDDLFSVEEKWVQLQSLQKHPSPLLCTPEEVLSHLTTHQTLFFSDQPLDNLTQVTPLEKGSYYGKEAPPLLVSFDMFSRQLEAVKWNSPFQRLSSLLPEGHITFVTSNEKEEQTLKEHYNSPKNASFVRGYLKEGFILDDEIVFPYTEISHRKKLRRQKQRQAHHTTVLDYQELTPGEYLVHEQSGIGQFLGIEEKPNVHGILQEFLSIGYNDQAKLFVPIDQSHLLSKYIGASQEKPQLSTIGSPKWKKTREKTEKAIFHYAQDLLEHYAMRELGEGFAYPPDQEEMRQFEEMFPYIESEDQLLAITAIKEDMQNPKPMDRLVCGDVGYGKTEVAMRAAFKAVMEGGKQVAVFVPTTLLALQHYENFVERMQEFPITICHMSRFLKAKEKKQVVERIAQGSCDIVIGTHRLLSQDVVFKDLGLVIIDEEQRFGVKAKEHLKQQKQGVDCLTLSATPIPRTLYMSLIGIRDISTIATPPQDRLPIHSVIAPPKETWIQEAILRELSRDGQIYFIHNRIETLFEKALWLRKLVPQVKLVVAHGQMHRDEIDKAFHTFKEGNADILVATTLVESGIDIPNANTIFIDRADQFGMADLYQLRGRVGRWNRRAFCYFLVEKLEKMPPLSRKRLEALAQASGYGGGMKVAMRDLELRGAGDLLGYTQSGHVSSIGFHLYCKLLQQTIKALKNPKASAQTECRVDLPVPAKLSGSYIEEVTLRMELYRRLGNAETLEEIDTLFAEIQDRFGSPPKEAKWLYHLCRIKVLGSAKKYTLIQVQKRVLKTERKVGGHLKKQTQVFHLPENPKLCEEKLSALL